MAEKPDPGMRGDDAAGSVGGLPVLPSPREDATALDAIVEGFKVRFPAEWDRLRLCPLQHGLETIVEMLGAHR